MAYCTCGNHVITWAVTRNGKLIRAKDKPFSFCGGSKKRSKKKTTKD